MNEGLEQVLATIIERLLDEHEMEPPLVVCAVGDNGSVLAGFNEGANFVVLTKQNDAFTLPITITAFSQNNKATRLVIERDRNITRLH